MQWSMCNDWTSHGILADTNMAEYSEDGGENMDKIAMDPIERYFQAYDARKELETRLTQAKQAFDDAKSELIAYMSERGLNQVGRANRTIRWTKRTYGNVRDFDALRRWARQQEEPISEFMEMRFIKGSSRDPRGIHMLLERAKQTALDTGKAVDECLPPGLEMSVVDVCTVRQVSQEKEDNVRARMRAVMEDADEANS